jgi:hypothetical protein
LISANPSSDGVRRFRPTFVHDVGGVWLATDDLQPVAVALSAGGEVVDVVSWNRIPAPQQVAWPWRRVHAVGSAVWVQDRPDGPTVRIDVSAAGNLSVAQAPPPEIMAAPAPPAYSRFARSGEFEAGDGTGWRFASVLDDFRWTSEVHRVGADGTTAWSLGAGSIVSWATAGPAAAVCVRRAPKRPWAFRPDHDLILLGANSPAIAVPDGLDVTELCWPRPSADHVAGLLADYLPFTVGECRTAIQSGATDVGFTVRDLDGLPRIETTFRLSEPGPRFVHVDEPVDELGRSVGLQFLNIMLDEDLNGSRLYRRAFEPDSTVFL